jgi:hypothetical protein
VREDRRVKVTTPFGRFPFEFRRVELKDGEVTVVGGFAGVESGVVFERRDLAVAAGVVVVGTAAMVVRRRGRIRG